MFTTTPSAPTTTLHHHPAGRALPRRGYSPRKRSPPLHSISRQQQRSSLEPIPEDESQDFTLSSTSVVRSTIVCCSNNNNNQEEEALSGSLLLDVDQLVLVNQDRRFHSLEPFRSSTVLNHWASLHATAMANTQSVFHSVNYIQELIERLLSDRVAENIQRGDGIVQMHEETMNSTNACCINRSNLLSCCFNEFGSAVALGDDGKLYSCQLFRSSSTSSTTSTTPVESNIFLTATR